MTDALTWYLSGMSFQADNQHEKALHAFDQSLTLDPGNAGAWVGKGMAQARIGDDQEAIQSFDRALALGDQNPFVWYSRGLAFHLLGNDDEAILSYNRAIATDKLNALTLTGLGDSLRTLERYERAREALRDSTGHCSGNRSGSSRHGNGRI